MNWHTQEDFSLLRPDLQMCICQLQQAHLNTTVCDNKRASLIEYTRGRLISRHIGETLQISDKLYICFSQPAKSCTFKAGKILIQPITACRIQFSLTLFNFELIFLNHFQSTFIQTVITFLIKSSYSMIAFINSEQKGTNLNHLFKKNNKTGNLQVTLSNIINIIYSKGI